MGNKESQLGDEPSDKEFQGNPGASVNQTSFSTVKNLNHFDHTFKGEIHTTSGQFIVDAFGECAFANRPMSLNCKGTSFEIVEEIGLKSKKQLEIHYSQVNLLSFFNLNR